MHNFLPLVDFVLLVTDRDQAISYEQADYEIQNGYIAYEEF